MSQFGSIQWAAVIRTKAVYMDLLKGYYFYPCSLIKGIQPDLGVNQYAQVF